MGKGPIDPNAGTSFKSIEPFEGSKSVILREGDIFQLYKELQGPTLSEDDYKERNLKYKIFVGFGETYRGERVSIPGPLLGQEVFIEREEEGNLTFLLKKKSELSKKLNLEQTKSYEKLIGTANEYVNDLRRINEAYRKYLKNNVEKASNGEREKLKLNAKEKRKELIKRTRKELNLKLEEFIIHLNANPNLKEDSKVAYDFLIKNAHFLFYDSVIVGSGAVADLKIEKPWISEHQGLIYRETGWVDKIDEVLYENIGLCSDAVIKYFKEGKKIQAELNDEYSNKLVRLIDFSDEREQTTFLFLSQIEQPLKAYEEFKTPPVYISFKLPAAK